MTNTAIPATLTAGESIAATITLDGYAPNDGYTATWRFAAPEPISVAGVSASEGAAWAVTLSPAQTLLFRRGNLSWDVLAEKAGGATVAKRGTITVYPSPLAVSQYAAALAAVEAAIATFGTNAKRSFSIGAMSVSYRSLKELLDLRGYYKREIARETSMTGGARIVRTRFTI